MKTFLLSLTLLIFVLILSGCGDSVPIKKNKYLGDLPSLAKSYKLEEEKLTNDAKSATTMDEAFSAENKKKLAKENITKTFKAEAAIMNLPIEIPFEGETETNQYVLKNLRITDITYNNVIFSATVVPSVTREYIFAYLQMLDENGNVLESGKDFGVLTVYNFRDVKAGEEVEMAGTFMGVHKLENFDKAVFRTKEYYEQNK
jgi:hypothetical protein